MSEAENLLNSLNDISVASVDPTTEEHIVIDNNRNVYVPESLRRIAVQHDHNIETVTFDCPRYWDGIDMSEMKVYINYRRSDGGLGQYLVEKVSVNDQWYEVGQQIGSSKYDWGTSDEPFDISNCEVEATENTMPDGSIVYKATKLSNYLEFYVYKPGDPNLMHFDWVISRNVTEAKGLLSFLVCIKTTDENGDEINHWNSELNQQMTVSEGLEVEQFVEELYPDIITSLLIRMDKVEADNAATREHINEEVNTVIEEKINNGELTGVDLSGYATKQELNAAEQELNTAEQDINENAESIRQLEVFVDGIVDYSIDSGSATTSHNGDDVLWAYEKKSSGIVNMYCTVTAKRTSEYICIAESIALPVQIVDLISATASINSFSTEQAGVDVNAAIWCNPESNRVSVTAKSPKGAFTNSGTTVPIGVSIVGLWK